MLEPRWSSCYSSSGLKLAGYMGNQAQLARVVLSVDGLNLAGFGIQGGYLELWYGQLRAGDPARARVAGRVGV